MKHLILVFFYIILNPQGVYSQLIEQLGSDIDGEAIADWSGWSASLSSNGDWLAIGSVRNDGNGNDAGHVRIYKWEDTVWVQAGNNIEGEAANDLFGHSVSLSADGRRVAIGSYRNSANGIDAGHVRIYEWDTTDWIQVGLDIKGEGADCWSGYAVSLSANGNRVAIGEPHNDIAGRNAGRVRVYDWDSISWVQVGNDIIGEAELNGSGGSVSLSHDGMRLAIGANGNNDVGNDAGHTRVYEWSANMWIQMGADIDGEAGGDFSGFSVALSPNGSRLAIGAVGNDGSANNAGQARVFEWDGIGWIQLGSDIDGEASEDASGFAVSLSNNGNRLAVAANTNDGNGIDAGHLRIFDWDGNNWLQLGDDIDGEFAGDRSGYSVSLSADGRRVAIGAPLNDGITNDAGHVRVYELPLMSTSVKPTASKGHIFEQISPNPAFYKTELSFTLKIPGPVAIRLFDSMGKLISKKSYLAKQGINRLDWEISQLTPGIYFFEFTYEGEVTFQKLMIKSN